MVIHDTQALDQPALLAALRARVSRMERLSRESHDGTAIPLHPIPVCEGSGLTDGGLARAALHELLTDEPGCGAAFAAMLLARSGGTVLWIAAGGDALTAWPPGLARFGLLPANLILIRADRWPDALWAMEEALRCPAVTGAVLVPDWQADAVLDLTASRRLQLAAEAGGGIGLLLRPDATNRSPSAAASRWRIAARNGAGAGHGMGDPCWQLELLRQRGGRPGGPWSVTWRAASASLELDAE